MFRLATRSLAITRLPLTASRVSTPLFANTLRFYSANALSREEITRRITEANTHLIKDPKAVTAESNLATDLGLDSLDSTEFLVNIENEFDLELSDEDSEKIKTIGQIVDVIAANPQAH